MATTELSNLPMPGSPPPRGAPTGSSGWLSPHSAFEQRAKRKLGGAFGVSLGAHLLLALLLSLGIRQVVINQPDPLANITPVFLNQPGPGGGGGGNPAPAPPKK